MIIQLFENGGKEYAEIFSLSSKRFLPVFFFFTFSISSYIFSLDLFYFFETAITAFIDFTLLRLD